MKLFGITIGKKPTEAGDGHANKPKADLKHQLMQVVAIAGRYETTIVALFVAILLAVTSLRMLHYMDPAVDDSKVQETVSKNKANHIDPKIVQKIDQLEESGTSTTPQVESSRTNPFTE